MSEEAHAASIRVVQDLVRSDEVYNAILGQAKEFLDSAAGEEMVRGVVAEMIRGRVYGEASRITSLVLEKRISSALFKIDLELEDSVRRAVVEPLSYSMEVAIERSVSDFRDKIEEVLIDYVESTSAFNRRAMSLELLHE